MNEILNSAFDSNDERDYKYNELFWNEIEIPDFILLDNWIIQDQNKAWYPMWCVYFSSSEVDNYCNSRDKIIDRTLWWELCDKSTTWSETEWDYVVNWPKLLKELWLIKWYILVKDDLIKALSNWNPIHTWCNRINWKKTKENNIAIIEDWAWHSFHIIGYNRTWSMVNEWNHTIPNNVFICKNSSNSYDNGFFYIKFDDISALYEARYIFTNDTTLIDNYKNKIMENIKLESAKKAFELWLWNWERPNETATREEVSAMIYRLYDKINL